MFRKPSWKPCILAAAIAAVISLPAQADNFLFNAGNYAGPNPITAADSVTAGLGGDKNFSGISLTNAGSFYWTVADRIGFLSSTVTNNNVFDIQADASLTYVSNNASSFINNATFQKSGGGASTTIGTNIIFTNNAGIINAASGTIDFAGGLATFNTGTQFNGGGINRVSNNASFSGAVSSVNLLLAGGIFTGNAATISGMVDWTGGNVSGGWTLASGQTLNAKAGGDKNFSGTTFVNSGTLNWQTTNRIGFASSAVTNNSLFDIQADANLTHIVGFNASSFTNTGTFRKSSGAGTTTVGSNVIFANNGGIINAASGIIDFAGNNATFNGGTQFTGAGINRVSGNASFVGGFTAGNLQLTAGTFTGTNAAISGAVDWTGGNVSGGWTLASGQTLNAKAGGDKNFSGTTFVNSGTLNWQTTNRIGFASSAVTNNSLFDIQADANLTHIVGFNASSFTNTGTFRKSSDAGTTTVGSNVIFTNNAGIINADSGIIDFAGNNATFNGGTQFTGAGINRVSGNASFVGGFTAGNLLLAGGTFSGNAAAISGTVDWTGGKVSGGWTLAGGQTLNAKAGVDKDFSGTTFVNNGTLNWQTTNRIGLGSSNVTNNSLFDIQADANLTHIVGSNASSFTNAGTLRKSGGNGSTVIGTNVVFTNPGVIEALSGTLVLPANFLNPGTITGGATIQTTKLTNSGHIAPGNSPGTLTLAGNFEQTAAGVLDIELASSVLFDKFVVNGTAQLAGTLALQCVGACAFNTDDTFVILDSTGALSGTFGSVTASGFGSGFDYSVRYDYAADLVELRVLHPGAPLPVPESESWAMLIAGLGLVGMLARRKAKPRSQSFPIQV